LTRVRAATGVNRYRDARARIVIRIRRLSLGHPGDVKPVGGGLSESPEGNPEFATVAAVLKALGLRLSVAA